MRRRSPKNGLWIILALGLCVPVLGGVASITLFPDWQWINPPFHALIKLVSGILAVTLGWLLFQRDQTQKTSPYFWVSCGFVSMGLLDIFHAGVPLGQLSIWLHSTTSLWGGMLFLLVYLSHIVVKIPRRQLIFLFISLGTGVFGLLSLLFPHLLPSMIVQDTFTTTTRGLTILGGLGFFIAAWYFAKRSRETQGWDDRFFAICCSIFGCASLLFGWTTLWKADWWWWHALRLVAYGTGLQYVMSFSSGVSVKGKSGKISKQASKELSPKHSFRLPLGRATNWLPLLVVAVVIITFAVGASSLYLMQQHLIQTEGEALAIAAVALAERVNRTLFERMGDIQLLAESPVLLTDNVRAITRYLTRVQYTYQAYHWIGVTNARGQVVAATYPDTVGLNFGGLPFFKAVQAYRTIQIQDAQPSEAFDMTITVPFGAPLLGPNGEFHGAVFAHVGLPNLEKLFARTLESFQRQGEDLEFLLLTKKGLLIVDSAMKEVGKINLRELNLPSALNVLNSQSGWVMEEHLRRHVSVITGYSPTHGVNDFQELGWGILVRRITSEVMKPIHDIQWKVGGQD